MTNAHIEHEAALIAATDRPRTRDSLAADLRALGVAPGEVLLVHSSLSSMGWIAGGAPAFAHALLDVLGRAGTLVVPAQTGENSDPRWWRAPPVPEEWWPVIRAAMPGYDPAITPSRGMGAVPEVVRRWPGAIRSGHPQFSFAAVGSLAGPLMSVHDLECPFGERSPVAAMEAAGARILMVGVDFGQCTALHLAEARVPGIPDEENGCAVLRPGGTSEWITYRAAIAHSADFAQVGAAFTETGGVLTGPVGSAAARLFSLPAVVAFATPRLTRRPIPAPSE
ncbi:MAG: Aminoglycoside N(3)-acetyltransferase [Actinomycetia bacterium]|nr:Aminoglycoside N(3)-acetyltransferase [Actinomycetes bacterium]